jgi:predicted CoA-binding protein
MAPIYGESGEGWRNPSLEAIKALLLSTKSIAVVGLSSNPSPDPVILSRNI